jgi:hypothetical protein
MSHLAPFLSLLYQVKYGAAARSLERPTRQPTRPRASASYRSPVLALASIGPVIELSVVAVALVLLAILLRNA